MSVQALLVSARGYCIYQAMINAAEYRWDSIEAALSFVSSVIVGVILLGLAAILQEIHKSRAKKRSIISV